MDWQKIKKEYESSTITLKALAEKYGVKLGTLKSRKSREKWSRGATEKGATKTEEVATNRIRDATSDKVEIDAPDLTEKQKRFVEEYMVDLNATQAAIRAGYSERTAYRTGADNLKKPQILTRIKELRAKQAEETHLDSLWVLDRLSQVVDKSMQEVPVMEWDRGAQELVPIGEYQYDSQGANKALELIGKHLGLFDPKARHVDELTKAQIDKIKAETNLIQERAKLFKGKKKDTSLLEELIKVVNEDE
ncbi:terminase small subunit [Bacillus sp. A301a_S52]|jgi:phage terminase small subunit|nr:terminase small subunit [Bacillus sp. A301a_S52]